MAESLNLTEVGDNSADNSKMKEVQDQLLLLGEWTTHLDDAPNMSDLVVKDEYYLCLAGAINTPGDFYLIPLENWNPLENLMADIQ